MFTGIVEEVGRIASLVPAGDGLILSVEAPGIAPSLALGESVCVDGACQTVTSLSPTAFQVQAVGTTLGRTTFGDLTPGRRVNLERALPLGGRLGGHLVQGHVDGVARVLRITPRGEHTLIDFELPEEVREVTVLHGSIALNGVSLTVNALPSTGSAQVSIIPFTRNHTALADLRDGQRVNVEGDLIGKYVRRLVRAPLAEAGGREGGGASDLLHAWGY